MMAFESVLEGCSEEGVGEVVMKWNISNVYWTSDIGHWTSNFTNIDTV